MTVNTAVLRKALEFITAHPGEWDQDFWAQRTDCGTTYCLAGTVAVQQGYELSFDDVGGASQVTTGEGIADVAERELGLTEAQADELFIESDTLRDLYRVARDITNGEIEVPVELPDGS